MKNFRKRYKWLIDNGMEMKVFLREIWEGLRRRERGGGRPARGSTRGPVAAGQSVETRRGQQDGDAGDAPGSVSTLGLRIFIMMG